MARNKTKMNEQRVAIVGGLRTPFVKAGGAYERMSTLDLARAVVTELVESMSLCADEVDQLVYGQTVLNPDFHNLAREIVLGTALPCDIEAYTLSRACITGAQALVSATQAIRSGDADVVICGGADSISRPSITYSDAFVGALMKASRARDPMSKAKALLAIKPRDLLPKPPAIRELSTGLTMGQSAEKMAKENGITREAQDAFALRSHRKAAEAWEKGIFDEEVMHLPVPPKFKEVVEKDNLVRFDTTIERLGKLAPVFDKAHGSVTAGNSSPLTDGASALLVMSEEKAKALGYEPLAFVKAWGFAGLDPSWQLLMGPAFATPKALDKVGMKLSDIDLVDMHEAFSAQVLSNTQAFASKEWAKRWLDRNEAIGEIPDEKLNIYGGSISLGHPFAATGARQALTMARELRRRGGGTALVTQCGGGALGAAVILER